MNKRVKNIIAFIVFAIFVIIGINIFMYRYNIKIESQEMNKKYLNDKVNEKENNLENGSMALNENINGEKIGTENNNEIDNTKKEDLELSNVYDKNGLLDVSKYLENEELIANNWQLFDEYKKYIESINKGEGYTYYNDNKAYLDFLYNKICFIGDSNVLKIRRLKYLPQKNIFPFGAEMLKDIIKKADDYNNIDVREFDIAVIWIGYNIKYIENSEHLISEYNRLIEKLKKQNPDIKVYACSLLPATKAKIDEDIANGSIHNFYRGTEYDASLKEYFKDQYIDTKVFIRGLEDYTGDGFHMHTFFYDRMIPYVGFYINFMELKGDLVAH